MQVAVGYLKNLPGRNSKLLGHVKVHRKTRTATKKNRNSPRVRFALEIREANLADEAVSEGADLLFSSCSLPISTEEQPSPTKRVRHNHNLMRHGCLLSSIAHS